jgi:hypothetical protein
MPYFLLPIVLAFLSPVVGEKPAPRLEETSHGATARAMAADVLTDADAIADLELVDHAAIFEVDQAGDRHELRLELDARGRVVGASLWWTGEAHGAARYDVSLLLPALSQSASLDAITVEDDAIVVTAGDTRVPIGADKSDDEIADPTGC